MPKRDASYMEAQREMIARAALECMLESGIAGTTTRDVCVRAGVSRGALYTHFKTREELILTAVDLDPICTLDPVDNWADYERFFRAVIDVIHTNDRHRKLLLASYEFLVEVGRADHIVPGVDGNWDRAYRFLRLSLSAMQARGVIALPLGLEPTVELHVQIYNGANYSLLGNRRLDGAQVRDGVLAAIAFTAGLHATAKRGRVEDRPAEAANTNFDERISLVFPHYETPASPRDALGAETRGNARVRKRSAARKPLGEA